MSEPVDGYVEGDVNTLDEALAPTAAGVLEYVARTLADEPDAVSVAVMSEANFFGTG